MQCDMQCDMQCARISISCRCWSPLARVSTIAVSMNCCIGTVWPTIGDRNRTIWFNSHNPVIDSPTQLSIAFDLFQHLLESLLRLKQLLLRLR